MHMIDVVFASVVDSSPALRGRPADIGRELGTRNSYLSKTSLLRKEQEKSRRNSRQRLQAGHRRVVLLDAASGAVLICPRNSRLLGKFRSSGKHITNTL